MDRKITDNHGFTLTELLIVIAIIAILAAIAIATFKDTRELTSINEDMHEIATFVKNQKLSAFTIKEEIGIEVAGTTVSAAIDPSGANTPVGSITLTNSFEYGTGGPFTINSRGNFSSTGTIKMQTVNSDAQYSCITISNVRIRLGEWSSGTCNAK